MEDQKAVANTILRTISESRTKTLTGGKIRDAIKASYPSFQPEDYGARNLRDFIRMFVPAVKEESRAGMDVVYAIQDLVPEIPTPTPDETRDQGAPIAPFLVPRSYLVGNQKVWKTFASPGSPWRLFFQPDTGVVRSAAPNDVPDSSWVRVPSCSPEAFLQIARSFIDTVPEPYRPVLTQTLTERKWWLPFYDVLRNIGLKTSWITFRRERLIEEFERTLSAQVGDWRARSAVPLETHHIPQGSDKAPLSRAGDTLLRRLAVDAIARMSEAELRGLNIPLGYIVDSLSGNR
jgi:hypothetical protein